MNVRTSYGRALTAVALALATIASGCSSTPSRPEVDDHADRRFFHSFSGLKGRPDVPRALWRSAAATAKRQVADQLDPGTAHFANTRLGGLWVILGLKHACLIDSHGALTCSLRRSAERHGMALGTILPSGDPAAARYAVQGVVPDSVRALRLRVDGKTRVEPVRRNTIALVATRPIVILGPVPQVAPIRRHLGA